MNLSIGLIPLVITALELLVILFFLRFLAWKLADRPTGQALAFLIG